MSIIKVANVHFETTGTNRIDYDSNGFTRLISGGTGGIVINTGSTDKINIGSSNVVISANITLGTTTNTTINVSSNIFFYQSIAIGGTTAPRANLDVRGTFTVASANVLSQTLTDAANIDWNTALGQIATVSISGNRIFNAPTNIKIGTYILYVNQDAVGGRTLTWNSIFKWPGGAAPVLTTAANSKDVFSFVSDGTNLYGSYVPDVR
jgi:hypothetical protein